MKAFAALYRRQDFRPPCGGEAGWGVALALPFFAAAPRLEVFGPTPLPNPPPQELAPGRAQARPGWGRELEAEA